MARRRGPETIAIDRRPMEGQLAAIQPLWFRQIRRTDAEKVFNSRFLILSWVRVPHLASHILGRMNRILPTDWQATYHHRVYYLETFMDKERFAGTCYNAANWIHLGVPPVGGRTTRPTGPTAPSRRFGAIRWTSGSGQILPREQIHDTAPLGKTPCSI